jgi:hypothetical protein
MSTGSGSPFYLPVLEIITALQLLRTTVRFHSFPLTSFRSQVATQSSSKTEVVAMLQKQSSVLKVVCKIIPGLSMRRTSLFLIAGSDQDVTTV